MQQWRFLTWLSFYSFVVGSPFPVFHSVFTLVSIPTWWFPALLMLEPPVSFPSGIAVLLYARCNLRYLACYSPCVSGLLYVLFFLLPYLLRFAHNYWPYFRCAYPILKFVSASLPPFLQRCFSAFASSSPIPFRNSFIAISSSPLLHHCLFGAIRSSLFLLLCISSPAFCHQFFVSILPWLLHSHRLLVTVSSSYSSIALFQHCFCPS